MLVRRLKMKFNGMRELQVSSRTARIHASAVLFVFLVSPLDVESSSDEAVATYNEVILSPQAELIRQSWEHQSRFNDLAYPLLVKNAELCGKNTRMDLGIRWVAIADFEGADQRIPAIELGVGHMPYIYRVIPTSGAGLAGLRHGDKLLAVNGKDVPVAPDRYHARIKPLGAEEQPMYRWRINRQLKQSASKGATVTIRYLRGSERKITEIQPQKICDLEVALAYERDINLMTVGRTIYVSSGLRNFAVTDAELQTFIAHELAHFIRKHGTMRNLAKILGKGADLIVHMPLILGTTLASGGEVQPEDVPIIPIFSTVGKHVFRKKHEEEADYLAAYLLERIGVSSGDVADTWASVPTDSGLLKRHGFLVERKETMNDAAGEIDNKRINNEPLDPKSSRKG